MPMSKKPSKIKPRAYIPDSSILLLLLFVVAACGGLANDGHPVFLALVLVLAVALVVISLCIGAASATDEQKNESAAANHEQKKSRRELRRLLARRKEAANFQAQLRKQDFETRLSSFTKANVKSGTQDYPESQMEFWEREEDYSLTPSRPIELIRLLLQRISKLIGQG